jgi:holo-[acyl-carrier protein] synthase
MIIGLGTDLASVQFWSDALSDPTTSVVEGTFTEQELSDAHAGPASVADRLATRFAAKEAFTKAIGSGRFDEAPVFSSLNPKDIELTKDPWGRPSLRLHGDAQHLIERFGVGRIWVSVSHENGFASATVILESE